MKNLLQEKEYNSIIKRINNLHFDSERKWGKMNASEMLVHCADPIREALGERPTKPLRIWFYEKIGKYIFLYITGFPKGKTPTLSAYDVKKKGTQPGNFEEDRNTLINLISKVYSTDKSQDFSPHPAFGKLNRHEWGRLGWVHLDHHLRQFGV
jgi:hypothetical protein